MRWPATPGPWLAVVLAALGLLLIAGAFSPIPEPPPIAPPPLSTRLPVTAIATLPTRVSTPGFLPVIAERGGVPTRNPCYGELRDRRCPALPEPAGAPTLGQRPR